MTILKSNDYYKVVSNFCAKHEMYKIETSPLVDNQYTKHYLCEDGAEATEINRKVYEKVEVEVKGLKCEVLVELLETEWFDSDTGKSVYMYERY